MGGCGHVECASYLHMIDKVHKHRSSENREPSSRGDQRDQKNRNHHFFLVHLIHWLKNFSDIKENEQQEERINPEHVSIKYNFWLISTYQSSLLKIMNPLFPLPKATWLLPLSHQLVKSSPSTTLRNMTMFLKAKHSRIAMHSSTVSHKMLSKFIILRISLNKGPTWFDASDAHRPSRCRRWCLG